MFLNVLIETPDCESYVILETTMRSICDKTKIIQQVSEQIQKKKIYELRDFNDDGTNNHKVFIFISYFTKISLY